MASTNDPRAETGPLTGPADRTRERSREHSFAFRSHWSGRRTGSSAGWHRLTTPLLRARRTGQPRSHPVRKWLLIHGIIAGLAVGGYFMYPTVVTMLNTVSTDDAYVNGHVTFVAPRVAGQVTTVLVDDNYRVKKGALLVELDKEPYQVQVNISKAAVAVAETNLVAAECAGAQPGRNGQSQSVPARARHRGRAHPGRQPAGQRGHL